MGHLILESYKLKKKLNNDKYEMGPNSAIHNIEALLNNSSIYGYKLLGAGGGGFFLVIGKIKNVKNILLLLASILFL